MYKSTADVAAGKTLYEYYSDVNDSREPHFLTLRSIVLARKQPRRMFVQSHTVVQGNCQNVSSKLFEVPIKCFEETVVLMKVNCLMLLL